MNLDSLKQYVKIKLVSEGVYNVYFADTHVFIGNFRYRKNSNLYLYDPPEYWDYTGDWDEDTLIGIGLHLKDLNLECANKAKETRQYD